MGNVLEMLLPLITAIVIIAIIIAAAYLKKLIKKLDIKLGELDFIKEANLSQYIDLVLINLINGTVDDVIELIVSKYQDDEDKIITKEDIPEIVEIALGMIKSNMSKSQQELIAKAFGDLDNWLGSQIAESANNKIK